MAAIDTYVGQGLHDDAGVFMTYCWVLRLSLLADVLDLDWRWGAFVFPYTASSGRFSLLRL